ncbi:MAG: hypothetical protein IRY94_09115 [Rhodospirillaceae bacterium]|nr:hypothetical protein [Rhodospirillaceae bacterium]
MKAMPGEPPARDRTQRVDAGPGAASTAAQRLGWAAVAVALAAVIVAAVGLHDIHGHLRRISNALDQQAAARQRLESTLGYYSANLATALLTGAGRAAAVEPGGEPVRLRLPCLTESMVGRIKADPSAVAGAFAACEGELSDLVGQRLGPLAEPDRFAIFATLVAFHWAPYGAGAGITMEELRTQTVMHCGQYAALTGHLLRYGSGDGVRLRFVGFEGPTLENHAQLFYSRGEVNLLLDPTVGLIAAAGFDEVMRGIPVKPSRILDFYDRTEIASFRDRIVTALSRGLYRPSELLYYYEGLDPFLAPWTVQFPTPGGAHLQAGASAEPAAGGEP